MRFLVHSSNATYNAVTKRYTVQLDRRVSNPTQLEIVGCSYVASTADLYPLTVYLRSDWAQNLAKQKHTVELKCEQHEDSSNVLGVLRKDASSNGFTLYKPFRFPVHGHMIQRTVDFF